MPNREPGTTPPNPILSNISSRVLVFLHLRPYQTGKNGNRRTRTLGHRTASGREILLDIFELIEPPHQKPSALHERSDGRVPEQVYAIQSLRLTCRRFNRVASPLLMRTLRVDYRYSSLRHLHQVSNHSLISSGVRAVRILLEGFCPEFAGKDDLTLAAFCGHFEESLKRTFFKTWPREINEYNSLDGTPGLSTHLDRGYKLVTAWSTLVNKGRDLKTVPDSKTVPAFPIETEEDCGNLSGPCKEAAEEAAKKAHSLYRRLYQDQQTLLGETGPSRARRFSNFVALAIAKMDGQGARSIEFIDARAIPFHHTTSRLSVGRFRSDWETCHELLLLEVSMAIMVPGFINGMRDLHNTIVLVPGALQAANVHFVSGISVDLESDFYYPGTDSIQHLLEALRALQPTSPLYRDGKVAGWKAKGSSEFLTTGLALPTLRRLDFNRPCYFMSCLHRFDLPQWPLSSENMPALEKWCTRPSPGDESAPEEAMAATISSPQVMRGELTSLNLTGGAFKLKDLLTILGNLSPSLDELTLNQVMLISSTMFEIIPATETETIIKNLQTFAGGPLHPEIAGMAHFLVAETLVWEQVLDFLHDARISRTNDTHPSTRKVVLSLRGFVPFGKEIWSYNPSESVWIIPAPLIHRLGRIWIPGKQQCADSIEVAAAGSGNTSSGAEEKSRRSHEEESSGMNAAEEYIMWQRDSNPIREFRMGLLANAIHNWSDV